MTIGEGGEGPWPAMMGGQGALEVTRSPPTARRWFVGVQILQETRKVDKTMRALRGWAGGGHAAGIQDIGAGGARGSGVGQCHPCETRSTDCTGKFHTSSHFKGGYTEYDGGKGLITRQMKRWGISRKGRGAGSTNEDVSPIMTTPRANRGLIMVRSSQLCGIIRYRERPGWRGDDPVPRHGRGLIGKYTVILPQNWSILLPVRCPRRDRALVSRNRGEAGSRRHSCSWERSGAGRDG